MTDLLGAREVRALLDRAGVRPSKSLGQNFVIDPNTIRKVVDVAAPSPDSAVLEIGAGVGSLTVGLAQACRHVTTVEVDARLVPVVEEVVSALDNVTVVQADALTFDLSTVAADSVIANLPYNIAATVVIDILRKAPQIGSLTVMTQREVAERLAAPPGSKIYGASSVLVAFYGSARVAGQISRRAFYPVPNVDSALVRIDRTQTEQISSDLFHEVVRAAFSQRRKMLRNGIAALAGSSAEAERVLIEAGISPEARAEQLPVGDFRRLTAAMTPR